MDMPIMLRANRTAIPRVLELPNAQSVWQLTSRSDRRAARRAADREPLGWPTFGGGLLLAYDRIIPGVPDRRRRPAAELNPLDGLTL